MSPIIDIRNLTAVSASGPILRDVSLSVSAGEVMALVGESGAGKSTIAKAVLGILPKGIRIAGGEIYFEGRDLLKLQPAELASMLGVRMALIPQDPLTSLNPARRIGAQLTDGLRLRAGLGKAAAMIKAAELLTDVHIREPEAVLRRYPHELSGGMRQRVLIAQAFSLNPQVIIADEPVSMIDVAIRTMFLNILMDFRDQHNISCLFITHNLSTAYYVGGQIMVLCFGRVVESGEIDQVIANPMHPYTQQLLQSIPSADPTERWQDRVNLEYVERPLLREGNKCGYAARCPKVMDICAKKTPTLQTHDSGQAVACHLY